ncbi:hypothetical protein [Chitinimonas lacunae]|uniref:Uncharacterized protein n=1 Tax=Chitinimonas lacunae TaxID=1963018 RepID=A0ABV8MVB8_9NEIS
MSRYPVLATNIASIPKARKSSGKSARNRLCRLIQIDVDLDSMKTHSLVQKNIDHLVSRLLTPAETETIGGGNTSPDHCQYHQTNEPYKQNCLDDGDKDKGK